MLARTNQHKAHLAAFLWRKGRLIKISINGLKHTTFAQRHYKDGSACSQHAEDGLLPFLQDDDVIEVIRWRKDGTMGMAKPCCYCESRLRATGRRIIIRYTDEEGRWNRLKI